MLHGDGDRNTDSQIHTTISVFVASCNSKIQQTLLQTATAVLVADAAQRVPVRVLFDSGSPRSYITKNVAESLALSPIYTAEKVWHGSDKNGTRTKKNSTDTSFTRLFFYRSERCEIMFWCG